MNGKVNKQVIEEASDWFVDFRVGDIDGQRRREFRDWLHRSPEHIQAYLDIAMAYAELPAPNPAGTIDVEALIASARSGVETNVITMARFDTESAANENEPLRRRKASSTRTRAFSIAASILLSATLAVATWLYTQRDTYATDIGEQRSLVLADGSTVELNSRSRIRVRYMDHERRIELLEGQALFEVAKNKLRPFIVDTGDTQVRAVGTQFDIYRKSSGTVVTVVEGKVSVGLARTGEPASTSPISEENLGEAQPASALRARDAWGSGQVLLAAGEQLTVAPAPDIAMTGTKVPAAPRVVDISTVTAWTQRQLIFDNASLADVAEEFNRYSARPIVVEAGAADSFHISGTYSSTHHESLLRFLRVQPGIRLIESEREIRITTP